MPSIAQLTRTFKQKCIARGINPENTTLHQLECAKRSLNPKTTSLDDLKRIQNNNKLDKTV